MGEKYFFKNLIGNFVFDENGCLVGKGEKGKEIEDIKIKKKILDYFKKEEFFRDFHEKNLLLSKKKIKEVTKRDLLIIHSVNVIKEADKVINSLAKRLREWYEIYAPEASYAIEDHKKFVELILKKGKKELLSEINVKEDESMGIDIEEKDLNAIMKLAEEVNRLYELRGNNEEYLKELMKDICPNILAIAGAQIGANLVALAGSLERLAMLPASTVQLLGAEKALFRHIKNKRNLPPKYGILHLHPLIVRHKRDMHGKIARALADKISIAAKIDFFKGSFAGDGLKKGLEEKFK